MSGDQTLTKKERLSSLKIIDALFSPGSEYISDFPIRVVYRKTERSDVPLSFLISVSKRRFKHAVDRNRVKRQLREAIRKNKYVLWDVLAEKQDSSLLLGLIWIGHDIQKTETVERKVANLFCHLAEKL